MGRLALAAAAGATLSAPVLVNAPGVWSLPRLGYPDRPAVVTQGRALAIRYRLPPGTRQGRPLWYFVRVHGRLEIDPASVYGEAEVVTSSRGFTCGSLRFATRRSNDKLIVEWSGPIPVVGQPERPALEVSKSGVCVIPGIAGGLNEARIGVATIGGARVGRLVVLPDSGLDVRRSPPTQRGVPVSARLTVRPPRAPVRAGQTFRLPFQLRRALDRPVHGLVVARVPRGPIEIVGSARRRFASLPAHRRVFGSFRLRATRPGRSWVEVSLGGQHALVSIPVGR